MNLKRISDRDRIGKDITIVFHSTRNRAELANIILSGKFSTRKKVANATFNRAYARYVDF